MTSIVFPGQGSQIVGMSKDFFDNYDIAKQIFEEIEDYSKLDLKKIIFDNIDNKLNLTKYTQISIFTASLIIYKTLESLKKVDKLKIKNMLGHSLGEYTALTCSEKISIKDCTAILIKRGQLMHDSVAPNVTGMAALIGLSANEVRKIIDNNKLKIEIANDNSPMQVVISGEIRELENSKEIFIKNNIKKFVKLNVSAAFHSNFMLNAQRELSNLLEKTQLKENKINIISNYTSNASYDNNVIKKSLMNQMANEVKWTESIQNLEKSGENKIIEIGPGNVLSGLIRRISNSFDIVSVIKVSDIEKL